MKKSQFKNIRKGIPLKEQVSNLNNELKEFTENNRMEETTKEVLQNITEKPEKANEKELVNVIHSDSVLDDSKKNTVIGIIDGIKNLSGSIVTVFNFENCPNEYDKLRDEAKYLCQQAGQFNKLSGYSLAVMAQRIARIREKKLYLLERNSDNSTKYLTFEAFIAGELKIVKRTVYKYLDIYNYFIQTNGVEIEDKNIEYTKLMLYVPLIKKVKDEKDKISLIKKAVDLAYSKSRNFIKEEVLADKIKFGLLSLSKKPKKNPLKITTGKHGIKINNDSVIEYNLANINDNDLIKYLNKKLKLILQEYYNTVDN